MPTATRSAEEEGDNSSKKKRRIDNDSSNNNNNSNTNNSNNDSIDNVRVNNGTTEPLSNSGSASASESNDGNSNANNNNDADYFGWNGEVNILLIIHSFISYIYLVYTHSYDSISLYPNLLIL